MGNRTSKISSGGTTDYTYNLNNNELTNNGGAYTYEANGNVIQRAMPNLSDYVYAYDFENRLTKVNQLSTSDSVRYEYDGVGQRTRKVGLTDTTRYTWDGLYPVVEWNNQGKLKQSFVYANGLLLGIVDSTLATNKRYFVLHDGLGSSICLTDSAASIKRSLIYSDFGQSLFDTSASGIPTLNRLYAGYSWDGAPANYYWMKYRQTYDPGVGRFGQEDPRGGEMFEPQNNNFYNYCLNSPIKYIDPSGLECCGECGVRIGREVLSLVRKSGLPGWVDGAADAFRHCVWDCEMYEQCSGACAEAMGYVHEGFNYLARRDTKAGTEMDLYNNAQGLDCGRRGGKAGNCWSCCMQKLKSGKLKIISGEGFIEGP